MGTQSDSFTTPPQSKYAIKEAAKPAKAKFISLEDECNWILSGREPEDDDDDDENTLEVGVHFNSHDSRIRTWFYSKVTSFIFWWAWHILTSFKPSPLRFGREGSRSN